MGRVHRFLGLTVGVILPNRPSAEHRAAYECDITYGTNNEFGFDYLRDNMAWSAGRAGAARPQLRDRRRGRLDPDRRGPYPADHLRPGRALRPVVRASSPRVVGRLAGAARTARATTRSTSPSARSRSPSAASARVEDRLGIDNLYESVNTPLVGYLNNAIKAKELYKRDKDYIVNDGEVLIVDEFTGRILHGRRYNEGMHQAIEAKEGVEIKQENQTLATITLQNYFRLYDKLSGMTGTAQTEAGEFNKVYKVGVVSIPTHRPMIRVDQPGRHLQDREGQVQRGRRGHRRAARARASRCSSARSRVENSEILSQLLRRRGIPHAVLNAKFHAKEAEIIAQAGRKGGGHRRHQHGRPWHRHPARRQPRVPRRGRAAPARPRPGRGPGGRTRRRSRRLAAAVEERLRRRGAKRSIAAGGLYVLGTERHESRRIDNQLRGRSGRQGDPGESRFYLSLQDELMRRFRAGAVEAVMERFNIPEDVPIESKMVTRQIKSAQTQIEGQNAEIRKNVLKYDEVLNKQRQVIYAERKRVLDGEDLHDQVRNMIDDVVTAYVTGATADGYAEDWDLDQLWTSLKQLYPVGVTDRGPGGRGRRRAQRHRRRSSCSSGSRRTRTPRTTGARRSSAPRRCASSSGRCCSRSSTASGASTSTRWTTCRRASACGRTPSATRWSSTSARASTCSPDAGGHQGGGGRLPVQPRGPGRGAPTAGAGRRGGRRRRCSTSHGRDPRQGPGPVRGMPQSCSTRRPTIDGAAGAGSVVIEEEPASPLGIGGVRRSGPASPTAAGERRPAAGQKVGTGPSRNAPCPCGSGKKYKRCHGAPGVV